MVKAVTIGNNQAYSVNIEKKHFSPQFKANKISTEDTFEKQDNTVKKVAIGTVIALGLAAAADGIFNHGKYLKKIFGKAEKAATETKPEAKPEPKAEPKTDAKNKDYENWLKEQEETKKAVEESNTKNAEWVEEQHKLKEEEYSNWWNKELNAKEEARIQAEKAAKEAQEKLKQEYIQEMDKIAQEKAIKLKNQWNQSLDTYTAIYEKGFSSISKGKEVIRLEDGTYKVITHSKKVSFEYYSNNGTDLSKIRVLDKKGNIKYEITYGRDQGKTGEVHVYNSDGNITETMSFSTISRENGNRLGDWNIYNGFNTEGLKSLYIDDKKVYWNALPPQNIANGLSLHNWTQLK